MPYSDLPAHRMAWDVDGTVLRYRSRASVWSTQNEATRNSINDEDTDGWNPEFMQNVGETAYFAWIFPELRTVTHWAAMWSYVSANWQLEYSLDTTDGSDGTWTVVGAMAFQQTSPQPYYRSQINAVTVNSGNPVKGIRLLWTNATNTDYSLVCYYMHWYGSKQTPAGLTYWDPTINQPAVATFLDFGDVNQGGTYTKTFRIKNNHGTQTANDIIVSATDVSGSATLQFSIDSGAYTSNLDIGDLTAGSISNVITARRIVPSNETIRLQSTRVSAVPTSWT